MTVRKLGSSEASRTNTSTTESSVTSKEVRTCAVNQYILHYNYRELKLHHLHTLAGIIMLLRVLLCANIRTTMLNTSAVNVLLVESVVVLLLVRRRVQQVGCESGVLVMTVGVVMTVLSDDRDNRDCLNNRRSLNDRHSFAAKTT